MDRTKANGRLRQAAEEDYTRKKKNKTKIPNTQPPRIRADEEIWAEMDIGQEQWQGPRDEGAAKAGNWLIKKQRRSFTKV